MDMTDRQRDQLASLYDDMSELSNRVTTQPYEELDWRNSVDELALCMQSLIVTIMPQPSRVDESQTAAATIRSLDHLRDAGRGSCSCGDSDCHTCNPRGH